MLDLFSKIQGYIIGTLILLLGLSLAYIVYLSKGNTFLNSELSTAKIVLDQKVQALEQCSENTLKLKQREDLITENAKAAVEEAKKSAAEDYKRSREIEFRKPKVPVITEDTSKNFGGTIKEDMLKDYVSTHDIFNEEIELRGIK